jgi:hypothetical protein
MNDIRSMFTYIPFFKNHLMNGNLIFKYLALVQFVSLLKSCFVLLEKYYPPITSHHKYGPTSASPQSEPPRGVVRPRGGTSHAEV